MLDLIVSVPNQCLSFYLAAFPILRCVLLYVVFVTCSTFLAFYWVQDIYV